MAETPEKHRYALILAGGSGTRLWPKSRHKSPKHFLALNSGLTLIQETVERIRHFLPPGRIFIICNRDYVQETARQIPFIPRDQIIGEPLRRNTAWASAVGAVFIKKRDPRAVIINIAADHVISGQKEFDQAVAVSFSAGEKGDFLVAIGIVPASPHTGYGYIHVGHEYTRINNLPVFRVLSFTEKPDKATALAFIASREYFWNASLYTWSVKSIISAFRKHLPAVYKEISVLDNCPAGPEFEKKLTEIYGRVEDIQIDKGISEKAGNLLMVPGNFRWSDIGDWAVIQEIKGRGENRNIVLGDDRKHIHLDTRGTLIHSHDRLIATIGLENMIIIDTKDALLVCPKDQVQKVKKIVEMLSASGEKNYL